MSVVLDASAVLALLNGEKGAELVAKRLPDAQISTVNIAEVGSKLVDGGMTADAAWQAIELLRLRPVDFDEALAASVYQLRGSTRSAGLSLGDRACLALALQQKRPAVTADRAWSELDLDCTIELIR